MARTELFSRKQPGGVFTITGVGNHPGDVYFVHAGTGTDAAGYGQNPDAPVATIDYAVGLCADSKNDVIYVMPGHTETVSAAAGIDLDKIGISVIGLGQGNLRPTITIATDTLADIDVDAASEAPDITVITDANANEMTIRRCTFNYLVTLDGTAITATPTECIRLVGADHAVIEECYIGGDFTTSAINGITTASKDNQIPRNRIHNLATEDIAGVVDLVAACNGVIGYNYGFIGYATGLATVIDPSSCAMIENFFSN